VSDEILRYGVELDTAKAEAAAKRWEQRLARLSVKERELHKAQQESARETARLRREVLKLNDTEANAVKGKGRLRQETRSAQQALREQAEAAKVLRREQLALKAETTALRREEDAYRRSLEKSARTIAATERARLRSARASERTRSVYQQQGRVGGNIEELQTQIADLETRKRMLSSVGGRARLGARAAYEGATSNEALTGYRQQFTGGLGGLGRQAVGAAATLTGVGAGVVGAVAGVGAERERLKAGLSTALGSEKEAEIAFEQIKRFAKETPFAVDETTAAVTKLKVRGLDPTIEAATESLRVYGDVAGAMGKDLDTVIEAVSDASLGEFERLKEAFNVVGRKAGDDVKFTFAGVTTTVKNDSESIVGYLKSIGQTNFAGGMAKQTATLGGAWSNLGDSVSNFAEEIYKAGLGDALKEVLHDLIGNVDGADGLAKSIGENLAGAVKGAYAWLIKVLGPLDELPDKISDGFKAAEKFVSVVGKMIAIGVDLAQTLGANAVAMAAVTAAVSAALGPFGLLMAAAAATGAAIGSMFADAESSISRLATKVQTVRSEAELRATQETRRDIEQIGKEANDRAIYADKAFADLAAAKLREAGVESIDELPAADRAKLYKAQSAIIKASQGETFDVDGETMEGKAFVSDLIERQGGRADQQEFKRLSKIPKKKLTPSQQKRLTALSTKLDIKAPSGAKGKADVSAAEAEQKSKIEEEAKRAGLLAADEARLAGRGAEALALGRAAEKETRARLKEQAARGAPLPGEVDTAFARIAGYSEVGSAPPPPVIVNNYQFRVEVPTQITGDFTGTPAELAQTWGESLKVLLEETVFPEALQAVRPSFIR
jgi:hypothetical protein